MKTLLSTACLLLTLTLLLPGTSGATDVDELARRLDIVTQELQTLKNESAVTGETDYSSSFGLGPAASKIYKLSRGLSLGGYGEGHYSHLINNKGTKSDSVDMTRLILYVGYKFTDSILLNSEIEFEHAMAGEGQNGEVAVEFANLDFLINPAFNLRTGLILVPVGISNELHEPTLYHGNDRPLVERQVIPATWREMGIGAFGKLAEGLDYKLYLINGLDAAGFDDKGIRSGRQNGSKAVAEDWAVVARLDYEPLLGLTLGGSAYLGNSGQEAQDADIFTKLFEGHLQFRHSGFELKGLVSRLEIDDTAVLTGVPERTFGWYAEGAYDVLPLLRKGTSQYLAPFVRFENIDYSSGDEGVELLVAGISYKPIPNVVLKADYRNFNNRDKTDSPDELNFGLGFIF